MIVMPPGCSPGAVNRSQLGLRVLFALGAGLMVLVNAGCTDQRYVAARPPLRTEVPSDIAPENLSQAYLPSGELNRSSPSIVVTEIASTRPFRTANASAGQIQQIILENLQKRIGGSRVSLSTQASAGASDLQQPVAPGGTRYIVRGSAEQTFFQGTSAVMLEAVNAESGAVLAAAAGRSEDLQHAASEAANRLAAEMLSRKLIAIE